ncbi:NAD(P)H-dependent oxidoreductase subunit E [Pseudonocardia phyllosphaerae]|uniref:NAD(P)H-dependent oxidoreductase subunit E n=1 Tax=Pseudonocardia phyllosphaerae TaxID=3390502 RepID=UPI00397AB6B1
MTSGVVTDLEQRVRALVTGFRDQRGPLLPILHALVEEYGHVDPRVIPVLADELNLSEAEVHGTISFYRDFRTTPPGRTTVKICRAEACQAVGANDLVTRAELVLGVGLGDTTDDGAVTLDEVMCLGNCALGPSVQVGRTTHGRFDVGRLTSLLREARTPETQTPEAQT